MAQPKVDGVIEAAQFSPDGDLLWVRVYERRGPTFSDRVLINRQELVRRIKAGKKFCVGQRKEFLASTFELSQPVGIFQHNGQDFLAAGAERPGYDSLEGVLLF
jgi:hypothetical protein